VYTYGGENKRRQDLVGKPEGKKPLVRPSSRWEVSVKMRLTKTELDECGSG